MTFVFFLTPKEVKNLQKKAVVMVKVVIEFDDDDDVVDNDFMNWTGGPKKLRKNMTHRVQNKL